MAAQTQAKLPPDMHRAFRLAYDYRLKYQNPIRDTAYWMAAAEEMAALSAQCNDHPLARALLLACYDDIERELKEKERQQCPGG